MRTKSSDVTLIEQHLRNYILLRFSLTEEEATTSLLDDLTSKSVAKAARIDESKLDRTDVAGRCDGVTARRKKKFLLFMALQEALGFHFTEGTTADIGRPYKSDYLINTPKKFFSKILYF